MPSSSISAEALQLCKCHETRSRISQSLAERARPTEASHRSCSWEPANESHVPLVTSLAVRVIQRLQDAFSSTDSSISSAACIVEACTVQAASQPQASGSMQAPRPVVRVAVTPFPGKGPADPPPIGPHPPPEQPAPASSSAAQPPMSTPASRQLPTAAPVSQRGGNPGEQPSAAASSAPEASLAPAGRGGPTGGPSGDANGSLPQRSNGRRGRDREGGPPQRDPKAPPPDQLAQVDPCSCSLCVCVCLGVCVCVCVRESGHVRPHARCAIVVQI